MGKATGFLEYTRCESQEIAPLNRIKNFDEFHVHISEDEQQRQAARCMDCGVPFCQSGMTLGGMTSGCPLNNVIPEWNDLVFQGQWKLALHRLLKTNRFAEFTSRVCPALCEAACTCSMASGDSVTVKENEYAIIEKAWAENYFQPVQPPSGTDKKIAVIGSGPSGLSVAEWLNKRGHNVHVFERSDRLGGLLMYGIPNMKLEKSVIDRRIRLMGQEGVVFETNCNVGKNKDSQELLRDFDAVVLCCGSSQPRDVQVEGRDAKGIYFAVDFLSGITKSLLDSNFKDGKAIDVKDKHVLVIGGGDTGNDCVGTSIRRGCKSITQLEMMPKPPLQRAENNPWPQWPKVLKTDYGQQESIAVFGDDPRIYQTTVKTFVTDKDGNVKGATISKLESKQDEATGRMMMVPTGEEFYVDADIVLIAAGFTGCESYVAKAFNVECDARGNVATTGFQTSTPKVFAAGDMRRGQSLVVWALREGKDVAREVDTFLMGYSNL
ncbi:MAG: glutamate synthase subunit beta [Spirochaetales bacterium]